MLTLLTHDAPWPVLNGGRARLVGLHAVLSQLGDVDVLVGVNAHRPVDVTAPARALPACTRAKLTALVGRRPRLGRGLLGPAAVAQVAGHADGLLLVSHSFLVPELAPVRGALVVDFPNLEVDRQASLGSLLGRVESLKARRWEPRVARDAALCIAVDEADADRLRAWGARRVVTMPNAAEVPVAPPSPVDGYVLAVADWEYAPNRASAEQLLALDLPLVLVGRGSESLPGGRGYVDDLTPVYEGAAVVVAPATHGGGTQLKVAEAVSRGRVVVTTDYGMRSVPAPARDLCLYGDLEAGARRMLADVPDRHRREQCLRDADLPRTWADAGAELREALEELLSEVAAR